MHEIIPEAVNRIVILTGAGISAESGVRTFRGSDGLWEGHRIEDVATPEAFRRNPERVHDFYNARRRQLIHGGVVPNSAHRALARLEEEFPGDVLVVTQNVDDLHERAGTRNLIHMHGELKKARCVFSREVMPVDHDLSVASLCPCCGKAGGLRPHIVWFGEMPLRMEEIERALRACDLFVSIGTSGQVYPAAGFVALASNAGAFCLELNLEPSAVHSEFDVHRRGPATELVPALVDDLLGKRR